MNQSTDGPRWRGRAAATAAFLLLAGGVMGILVDRHWLSPPEIEANPITAEAMAARLGLSSSEAARVQVLLDSLHTDLHAAARQGPDPLWTAVRDAQRRIEEALPPEARAGFRAWMEEQHEHMTDHMTDRMRDGPRDHRRMHGVEGERRPHR